MASITNFGLNNHDERHDTLYYSLLYTWCIVVFVFHAHPLSPNITEPFTTLSIRIHKPTFIYKTLLTIGYSVSIFVRLASWQFLYCWHSRKMALPAVDKFDLVRRIYIFCSNVNEIWNARIDLHIHTHHTQLGCVCVCVATAINLTHIQCYTLIDSVAIPKKNNNRTRNNKKKTEVYNKCVQYPIWFVIACINAIFANIFKEVMATCCVFPQNLYLHEISSYVRWSDRTVWLYAV